MEISNGRQYFGVGLDLAQLRQGAAEAKSQLHSIGEQASAEGAAIDSALNKIGVTLGGIFAAEKIKGFVSQVMSVRSEIENLQISFTTLLGSEEKANKMFTEIRQFAVQTPMMLKDLAAGAQTMLAFNIESEKVMPILKSIGDISMGDSQKFQSLTLAFSQMSATGKLMGQDLLQMINAGFNPLSVISQQTGKSIGELKDEMSQGAITADMVTQAFIAATSEGGQFYEMLEKMSHGLQGSMSNLQGAIDDAMNELGENLQGTFVASIDFATTAVKNFDTLLTVILSLIAAYGTYKAALMANTAVESLMANASAERMAAMEAEIMAIGTKTEQETLAADADITAAVASGQLTTAEGLHLLALKQEAAARVAALAIASKQASAEAAEATAIVAATKARVAASVENLKAAEARLVAAQQSGDMWAIEAAAADVETAAEERNAAVKELNAAIAAEVAAKKAADTAATTANTAAQELNTLSVKKGTAAMGIFETAVMSLRKALAALWATMTKHPVALVIAALAALAVAIYRVTQGTKEVNVEQQALEDIEAKASSAIQEEKTKLEALNNILHDNTAKLSARKKALAEIQEIVPDYHASLTAEGKLINDNSDALDRYVASMLRAAKIAAIKEELTASYKAVVEHAKAIKDESDNANIFGIPLGGKEARARMADKTKKWYESIVGDPLRGIKTMSDGKTGYQVYPQILTAKDTDGLSDEQKKLISALETYQAMSNIYEQIVAEDVESKSRPATKPKAYLTEVAEKRKELEEANAELKRLQTSATATTEEVQSAQKRVETAKKKLKELGINADSEAKSSARGANVASSNSDMLNSEAANRRQQTEAYTQQLADQTKDSEFEIEQARIDAMKDGLEKTLAQNELNYNKLEEQNKRRLRDMLDALADQQMRDMEDENPHVFKRQNSDGKWEDAPGARAAAYKSLRDSMTIDSLPDGQKRIIEEYSRIASDIRVRGEKEALKQMLADVETYEQKRNDVIEEYQRKRESLYTKDESGNITLRNGVTQGNVDELSRNEEEALKSIDEQFASREAEYQSWCNAIGNLSLKQLEVVLKNAKAKLDELKASGKATGAQLAVARAKVSKAEDAVKKAKGDAEVSPNKRSIKEWEDLYKTLNDVRSEFEEIGETIGGVVGDIIKECGQMTASTLQMINGIKTLVSNSSKGIEETSEVGSKAIQSLEKASVILTIISSAMQLAMAIVNLFNNDDKKQEEIDALQQRIDQLQWELDNADALRSQKTLQAGSYLQTVKDALANTRQEMLKTAQTAQGMWGRIRAYTKSISSDSVLLKKTANEIATAYGNMKYTADKALGAAKYDDSKAQLENIAKQQIMIQEQIQKERSKKDSDSDAISEYEQKIVELGQDALEIINDMMEEIIGDTSTGIAETLSDAFFDAFEAGEDAAEAWGDAVNDIVSDILKNMMVSKYLEEPLGELFDKYKKKWFPDGQFTSLDAVMSSMNDFANDLNAELDNFQAVMDALPDDLKQYFIGEIDDREASEGSIATASQESIDELNGRATAIQSHTYSINELTKSLVHNSSAILASVMNIESYTNSMAQELSNVRTDLTHVRAALSDIQLKGIKLT
jgi:tape measure domain-containing protein